MLCSPRTDGHTHRQTHTKVTTVGTLSGFHKFFLQPIIKDRPNANVNANVSNHLMCTFFATTIYRQFSVLYFSTEILGSTSCRGWKPSSLTFKRIRVPQIKRQEKKKKILCVCVCVCVQCTYHLYCTREPISLA